jgi:uncharacterized membrane protein
MERIERSVEVDVPVRTAYDRWTRFEEFPRFMKGVERVDQLDDNTLHWIVEIGGVRKEWDAKIVRQEPDREIRWVGFGQPDNEGAVTFEPSGSERTRVTVSMGFEPEGLVEKAGDALGIVAARVEGDVQRFKDMIEERSTETGAWRGRIAQGGTGTEG